MIESFELSRPSYNKPPIVEAVIALHLSRPLELKWMDNFFSKKKHVFPRLEELTEITTTFDSNTKISNTTNRKTGIRLNKSDESQVINIMPTQFGIIHRAPYTKWDDIFYQTKDLWISFRKLTKDVSVKQMSTRFINRIDIPIDADGVVSLEKYFTIGLSLPAFTHSMALENFHISCSLLNNSISTKNVLQFYSTVPSLVDRVSFFVDLDISTNEPIPHNDDKMWELLYSLRQAKNDLFESCITDKTRKLFQ